MKKVISVVAALVMSAVLLCACGYSASTQSSKTGRISTKIENNKVTLNHTSYEFPEEYKFEDFAITDPVGISAIQVADSNGKTMGIVSDGMYTENITEENMVDAANTVYMTVHGVDTPLELEKEMFVSGKNVKILVIGLTDGTAIFVAQTGTPNFAYMTETNDDSDLIMQDQFDQIILQLGGQEDYDMFCTEN